MAIVHKNKNGIETVYHNTRYEPYIMNQEGARASQDAKSLNKLIKKLKSKQALINKMRDKKLKLDKYIDDRRKKGIIAYQVNTMAGVLYRETKRK